MIVSVLRRMARHLPGAWRNALVTWRWRLNGKGVRIRSGVRMDGYTHLADSVAVGRGSSLFGVEVGRHSYFGEGVLAFHSAIGAFCSIAPRVVIGGGRHPTREWVSTCPMFYRDRDGAETEDAPRFDELPRTHVGHDVWLGYGAIVLPGVRVGTGAIVAAGAVVTRDVAPYEIVAGVPARVVRSRFAPEEVAWLLASEWWTWDDSTLRELRPHFASVPRLRAAVAEREATLGVTAAAKVSPPRFIAQTS